MNITVEQCAEWREQRWAQVTVAASASGWTVERPPADAVLEEEEHDSATVRCDGIAIEVASLAGLERLFGLEAP